MAQCNPKCPVCDGPPVKEKDVLRFDWYRTVEKGGKILMERYGSDATQDMLIHDLFASMGNKPTKSVPDRFYWVHVACFQQMCGAVMSLIRRKEGS